MKKAIMSGNTGGKWQINTSILHQTLRHPPAFATSPHCTRTSPNRARPASMATMIALQAGSTHRIQHEWHILPDGTKLEVLTQKCDTDTSSANPPLLMLHGAGHAAWCYKENFMPYFADRGYNTYAISFRCQGSSDMQRNAKFAGTLASHSADIQHFVSTLPEPPVILAHSLGGLIAQRFVLGEQDKAPSAEAASIAGLVLLGSSPPYGTSSLVWRTFCRRPFFSVRLTCLEPELNTSNKVIASLPTYCKAMSEGSRWDLSVSYVLMQVFSRGFIKRSYARSMPLFRDMFMSSNIPEKDLQRYYQLLQENMSSVQLVDFSQLNKQELPLQRPGPNFATPVLALCGDQDLIVDMEAAEETAAHFDQGKAVELKGMAHDLMLDTQWQQAASTILEWLQQPDKAA